MYQNILSKLSPFRRQSIAGMQFENSESMFFFYIYRNRKIAMAFPRAFQEPNARLFFLGAVDILIHMSDNSARTYGKEEMCS